jgi:hypothetical protein
MDEIKKEENQQSIEEKKEVAPVIKHPDDNGCTFFNWCKNINKDGLVNCTCFHPIYYMDKLERKCTQLGTTPKVVVEVPKEGEVKETVREQIKKEILKDNKNTFTVVDIIKQEVARGNKDAGLIFQALKTIFPNEKDADLRKRIKPTISYLEKKSGK